MNLVAKPSDESAHPNEWRLARSTACLIPVVVTATCGGDKDATLGDSVTECAGQDAARRELLVGSDRRLAAPVVSTMMIAKVSTEPDSPLGRIATNRARVSEIREQVRQRFLDGTDGISLLATLSEAMDKLVVDLLEEALTTTPPELRATLEKRLTVLAVGGSGRGEMCPHSDVDLLFLYQPHPTTNGIIQEITSQVVRDLWDAWVKLGHSVRTLSDALAMARTDLQFATALIEIRTLWGNPELGESLHRKFYKQVIRPRQAAFIDECVASRQAEFQEHGGTVQQLQPDVKRSAGGLRDLHLLKWIGYARLQTADLGMLRRLDVLTRDEHYELQQAHEFLSRVRIDLHFAAGRPQDVLSRDEQARIARERGFQETSGQHPAVQFMQQYFRHTSNVARIVKRFATLQRPRSIYSQFANFLLRHRANDIFLVSPTEIDVQSSQRAALCSSLEGILKLYELASMYRVAIAPVLAESIGPAAAKLPDLHTAEEARLTLSIFKRGAALGPILRSMHETGVLEKVIPEFRRTRCLLQFNQYHHYTVDEHTLRAIEAVTSFEHDPGPLGEAYRTLHHREVLHLAVLLHDVGKGGIEDHSEVGRVIAGDVANRLGLSSHQREMLMLLVHKHLIMPDLALRRNINDPGVYLPFSREVGSPEVLRMLYVLSAADMIAVGPETWTTWKGGFLADLYRRALEVLSGQSVRQHELESLKLKQDGVRLELAPAVAAGVFSEHWIDATFETLPRQYIVDTSTSELAAVLRLIRDLKDDTVHVRSTFDAETKTVEYRVIAWDRIGSGCFSKMAGALAAKRLDILSAQIVTSSAGVILDSFRVVDHDYFGAVPESRMQEVATAIQDVLLGRNTVPALFVTNTRHQLTEPKIVKMPTRVVIDNDSSEQCSVIDVFASDRTGLLYVITKTLLDLDLSVSLAKIATHIDQVLDVFYVTDSSGKKIQQGERLAIIRDTLQQRIEAFEATGILDDAVVPVEQTG